MYIIMQDSEQKYKLLHQEDGMNDGQNVNVFSEQCFLPLLLFNVSNKDLSVNAKLIN